MKMAKPSAGTYAQFPVPLEKHITRKGIWLKKPTIAKCLCFVPLDADFMETLVRTACVQYAIKNIFNGRMVVMVELAHQVMFYLCLAESLPVQCTEGSIQDAPSTLDSTPVPPVQPSPVSSPSTLLAESVATCEVESTAIVDKTGPEREDVQESTSVDLAETISIDSTGEELSMDNSDLPDTTRGSETECDYDASVENNIDDPDSPDESSRVKTKRSDTDVTLNTVASASDNAEPSSEEQDKSLDKPKQKKTRCFMCRKKVGLTGFECRCGNVYCGVHRYSDVHSCSYNYKADAAEKIRKENPVVVGEKIQKI
ncbi:hypothetical protein JD844_014517 [Phrynosoma platyrhinos]|uniref:AN1-type domain-containing protein n=1 Tax=Phrynosoma platyrhinos TaxID=52577 RepID=A0ABQ7SRN7_PHRPL|nr:hypothetical protein JD844_014517 [Phrynosoma platyrhinos]